MTTERPFTAADEREASNYKIRLWVEKSSGFPIRTAMEIVGDHSKLKKGSQVLMEDFQVEDGTWLPRNREIKFVMQLVGPYALRGVSTESFSDFRKFQVDSKISGEDR